MIEKPTIIITSLGRTGTKFFFRLFDGILDDATALHEPDVFNFVQYKGTRRRLTELAAQFRESGVLNMTVRKLLGQWGVIRLSDGRVIGQMNDETALKKMQQQRNRFVETQHGSVYVEANAGFYGLIDLLPQVFTNHKIVYIIRDGRDWVRSKMNWGEMYGKGRARSLLAHNWPVASQIPSDPYSERWSEMTRFERICWSWVRLNEFGLRGAKANPNCCVFQFEDLFKKQDRYDHLAELVSFCTDFNGAKAIEPKSLAGWLERQEHKSSGDFPKWPNWTTEHKEQFSAICGSMMDRFNYPWE